MRENKDQKNSVFGHFSHSEMNWGIPKYKIWHDVKHIAVSPNLNPSMSTITVTKIKNYLN